MHVCVTRDYKRNEKELVVKCINNAKIHFYLLNTNSINPVIGYKILLDDKMCGAGWNDVCASFKQTKRLNRKDSGWKE